MNPIDTPSTEPSTITTRSAGVRYGLINAAVGILYFVAMTVAGVDMMNGPARWASFVFFIVLLVLAQKYYKDNGNGFMDYGTGMGVALWHVLTLSVISNIFTYVYVKFIDAEFIATALDKQREAMEEKGMPSEQIDAAMRMTAKFMTPESMLLFGLIGGFLLLMICALIVTIFTQKKSPEIG